MVAACSKSLILFLFWLPKIALVFWQVHHTADSLLSLKSIKTRVLSMCVINKPPINSCVKLSVVFIFKFKFVPVKVHIMFNPLLQLLEHFVLGSL